jgi:hypothetical protein
MHRLDKLVEKYPEVYKSVRVDTEYLAKRYTVPASFIRFGKPQSAAQLEASRKGAAAGGFQKAQD